MSRIYLTTDKDQVIDTNDPIQPTTINLFLAVSLNQIGKLFPLFYSLQKYSKSNFNVYIMTDDCKINKVRESFNVFVNEKFNLTFLNDKKLRSAMRGATLNTTHTPFSYAKMLIPTLFPNLDKMLYLDYDVLLIKEGIEWLYNIDLKDKYIAVKNGNINYGYDKNDNTIIHEHQIFATRGNFYFNSGIMLFNNKKIIQDGKDKELLNIIKNRPDSIHNEEMARIKEQINYDRGTLNFSYCDQSLLNWLFKESDVIKFNNIFNSEEDNLFSINQERVNILKNTWEFKDYQDYFDNIVIAHYCGTNKPWLHVIEDYINEYQIQLHTKYKEMKEELTKKGIGNNIFTIL